MTGQSSTLVATPLQRVVCNKGLLRGEKTLTAVAEANVGADRTGSTYQRNRIYNTPNRKEIRGDFKRRKTKQIF